MLAAALVAAGVGVALLVGWATAGDDSPQPKLQADKLSPGAATAASGIEVPSVVGDSVDEASLVIEAAGLTPVLDGSQGDADAERVAFQRPDAGAVLAEGSQVVLTVGSDPKADGTSKPLQGKVVVIDPGHQRRSNMALEPIGPSATETKPKVTGGTSGIETELAEYEVVLQIATNLKTRLEAAGAKVVMTRSTNDVDVSNQERASIANDADADAFVRVHADGSPDSRNEGISTLYPEVNKWTRPIAAESRRLARLLQQHTVATTGATDRGTVARADLSGFNYAKVPVALIECGFLSNPVEDKLLSSPHYQDKLAEGITQGVVAFLSAE